MDRRLNILIITHHRRHKSRPRAHAMARHLVQLGHKVSLVVIADRRKIGIVESEWDVVHVIETPDLLWGRLRSGWDLWGLLNRIVYLSRNKGPYDLVHCFETRPATIYPALLYCHRHKLPLVTDWNDWWGRGGLIDEVRPKWYRFLFGGMETYYEEAFRKRAAGLTVISSALAKRAAGLGVPPDHICHLPGGTLPDFFLPRPKAVCCDHVGLSLSGPVLGYSSQDSALDIDIVLQALSIVAKRYASVKLIITGKQDGSITKVARSLGVEDNVLLTGWLPFDQLPWYLGCADLFVMPFPDKIYNVGRWPNKICDYMSMGRPTISNPVGEVRTLFEKYEIGLLAHWDPTEFAQRIIYLIEHPEIASELGTQARNVATSVYDWKLLICKLEDFYYSITAQDLH